MMNLLVKLKKTAEDVSSQSNAACVSAPVQENNQATIQNMDFSSRAFNRIDDNGAYNESADPIVDGDGPDKSVMESYEKLLLLCANPLNLEKFSQEEKVQILLL